MMVMIIVIIIIIMIIIIIILINIFRRVLSSKKTGYPLVPQDHGLVSALRTLSKHYVKTIIIIIIIIIDII